MKSTRSRRFPVGALAVLALGLLVAAAAPAGAATDADYKLKPGARGRLCLGCHEGFREILDRSHVHTPVAAGDCADCHDPHASEHGKLLASDPSTMCAQCHDAMVPDSAISAHSSVVEGNCTSCHDPHASNHANNLLRGGNQLCAGCHEGVARTVEGARFGHAPARSDCLSCHDPHGSAKAEDLLASAEPSLCLDCHDASGAAFVERHKRYPVDRGSCTTCHAPHGSDSAALLWDNVHPPVANRMCDQCHVGGEGSDPLATKRIGAELCRGCHNAEVTRALTASRPHWPAIVGDACANCHNPHASPRAALLADEPGTLCQSCHSDVTRRLETSHAKHQPIVDGECATCHEPHGSERDLLLAADTQTELCGTCHDWKAHSMHPIGEDAIDMRNPNLSVDCGSCHRTHGTAHDHLAPFDSGAGLCVECHETFRR